MTRPYLRIEQRYSDPIVDFVPTAIYFHSMYRYLLEKLSTRSFPSPSSSTSTSSTYNSDLKSAIYMWTSDHFYEELNEAVSNDHFSLLEKYLSYMSELNRFVRETPPKTAVVSYRVVHVPAIAFSQSFSPLKKMLTSKYTSTTLIKPQLAEDRIEGRIVCVYHIPEGCANASPIYEWSQYPDEKEVLILPYTEIVCSHYEIVTLESNRKIHYFHYNVSPGRVELSKIVIPTIPPELPTTASQRNHRFTLPSSSFVLRSSPSQQLYKALVDFRFLPKLSQICKNLPTSLWPLFEGLQGEQADERAAHLWTTNTVDSEVKYGLLHRTTDTLSLYKYYLCGLEHFVWNHAMPARTVVYTSSEELPEEVEKSFVKGKQMAIPFFVSASESEDMVDQKASVMFVFEIPEGSLNATILSRYSRFNYEKEVLIIPYAVLECDTHQQTMKKGSIVHYFRFKVAKETRFLPLLTPSKVPSTAQKVARSSRFVDTFRLYEQPTPTAYHVLFEGHLELPTMDQLRHITPSHSILHLEPVKPRDQVDYSIKLWSTAELYEEVKFAVLRDQDIDQFQIFLNPIEIFVREQQLQGLASLGGVGNIGGVEQGDSYKCYRSYAGELENVLNKFLPDHLLYTGNYVSCSANQRMIKDLCTTDIIFVFVIPKGCNSARPIWDHSLFAKEEEIIILPHTPLRCISHIKREFNYFTFEVMPRSITTTTEKEH